jgi:hypothetical protein
MDILFPSIYKKMCLVNNSMLIGVICKSGHVSSYFNFITIFVGIKIMRKWKLFFSLKYFIPRI